MRTRRTPDERPATHLPSTSRCQLPDCSWTFSHHRQVIVDAAWREHYAAHKRGEQCLRDFAEYGTVHPPRSLPDSATVTRADHNREKGLST